MSLGKKDISINISSKAQISSSISINVINSFIELIKINSQDKIIKISKFGGFYRKSSPARIGRNPKTKEEFIITERSRLTFKSSDKVKNNLN
jgi:integration host factor subunit alpha